MEGHRGTEEEEASSKRVSCGLERACEEWESGERAGEQVLLLVVASI